MDIAESAKSGFKSSFNLDFLYSSNYLSKIFLYVWIFQNGVEFEAKLYPLPAGDSRQGSLCGAWKGRGGSVKEGRGRKPRGLATSCYHRGAPGIIPWQGIKLTFFFGSHLAPKFVKVVANSKKLAAIMRHTHKKSTFHASINFHGKTRSKFARAAKRTLEWVIYNVKGYLNPRWHPVTIDLRSKSYMHVLRFESKKFCCRFIFTNLQQSLDLYR